jgi:type I restriction enzyme S subunit
MSNKLVPKLRFKEFSGEWEEKKLEEITTFITNKISIKELNLDNYISTENLLQDFMVIKQANKLPDIKNVNEYKKADILISNIRPYLKKIWFATKDGGASNDIIIIRSKNISSKFLSIYLKNDKFINYVMVGARGVKMPRGDIKQIKQYKLYTPQTTQEQQKIADTISSHDNLIEAHNTKLETLKEYKKGLMQKLFPTDDEKAPKLRFKEFCGEWEEERIEDIFLYKNGGSFEKNIIDNGQYNLVTLNSIDINGELKKEHKTINIESNFLNKNNLIMVLSDVAHGNFLGLTAIIPESNKYILNQRMGALSLKTNDNIKFIRFFINYNQKYFKTHGHGSSQQNLSKDDILKFIILLPTQQEQQKIADTLSSLDNLIEKQTKKIESLKTYKKGLMQQMFINEELE